SATIRTCTAISQPVRASIFGNATKTTPKRSSNAIRTSSCMGPTATTPSDVGLVATAHRSRLSFADCRPAKRSNANCSMRMPKNSSNCDPLFSSRGCVRENAGEGRSEGAVGYATIHPSLIKNAPLRRFLKFLWFLHGKIGQSFHCHFHQQKLLGDEIVP